jgi:competence protein ComEC
MLLIALSLAWVLGIFLGAQFNLPWLLILSGALPVPLVLFFRRYKKLILIFSIALVILFAASYYSTLIRSETHPITTFNNSGTVEIKGTINSPPEIRDNITHIVVTVQEIRVNSNWQNIQGDILFFAPRYPEYYYGDIIFLKGKLQNPPKYPDFDYQAYLAKEGIYCTSINPQVTILERGTGNKCLEFIYSVREHLSQILAMSLPEPQASLAQGIVLGIRSTIPDNLKHNLAITGTVHLLAISGINLTIITGLFITLGLWVFGRRYYIYIWLTLFLIWFYSFLTGLQAPVIRSAIMASLFLFAELLGRQKNTAVALTFCAAVMVGITPQILWNVSFQLSFLAMLGLILISPILQRLGQSLITRLIRDAQFGVGVLNAISGSLSISLAAVVFIWPVIVYNFGLFSIIGPLATFLISPALPAIIIAGAITAITGFISLPVAQIIGYVTWIPLTYMLWLVNAFASFSISSISIGMVSEWFIWIYYCFLVLILVIKSRFKVLIILMLNLNKVFENIYVKFIQLFTNIPKKWIIIPLIVLAFLTTFTAATLPDDKLHVSFLDVGEGDACLIQNNRQAILIDGGPSPQSVCRAISQKLPVGERDIDMIVLTHPHLDHITGLIEILRRYNVKSILAPNLITNSPYYQEWKEIIRNHSIPYTLAKAGQHIQLKNGASLDILNPHDTVLGNSETEIEDCGIVAKLTLKEISFLLTADISSQTETQLIHDNPHLETTVLKIAHHGSSTSTSERFLKAVKPQYAIISVGANNTFGHPSNQTLNRLTAYLNSNQMIYRTDKQGSIEFITDGESLLVKTEISSY